MSLGLLTKLLPDVADELHTLICDDYPHLAAQISELEIIDKCRCGDEFCSSFYTAPKPEGGWGKGHKNIMLKPETGDFILDVVGNRIVHVEILDRKDIKNKIDQISP
ncbi:MAG: hypothetical protein MI865_08480 [Proteobacteria bacterium]|nr:hypothetical protein [Pseudomonadota bacterium]